MFDPSAACRPPGSAGDPVAALRRQAVLVDDLMNRLSAVLRGLPADDDALHGWWGPAREALGHAISVERARLAREVARLDSVRMQFEAAASTLAVSPIGGLP